MTTKAHSLALEVLDIAAISAVARRADGRRQHLCDAGEPLVVDGNATAASAVVDRLKLFSIAPSLGGVESLVTQPITTTHHGVQPDDRLRRGIVDRLVRVSVGLEDVDDLWADSIRP